MYLSASACKVLVKIWSFSYPDRKVTGTSAMSRKLRINSIPSVSGSSRIRREVLHLYGDECLLRVTGHNHVVTRLGKGVPNAPESQWTVVHR